MILGMALVFVLTIMFWWIPILGPFLSGFIPGYLVGEGVAKGLVIGLVGGLVSILIIVGGIILLGLAFLGPLGILLSIFIGWGATLTSLNIIIFTAIGGAVGGYIGRKKSVGN